MKYIKLFEAFDVNKLSIEKKLTWYNIQNYTINEDGTIDVNGDVDLSKWKLNKVPFNFGRVSGSFTIYWNSIRSLEGCPYYVGGDFSCRFNLLINLEYSPKEVGGEFNCSFNAIISLEGCPEEVGGSFNCSGNRLETLDKCPAEVDGNFDCSHNKLTDINISSNINGTLFCNSNMIDPNNYQFYGECEEINF